MKITVLLLTLNLVSISASVYSQDTPFTLPSKDMNIKEVISEIENQTNYRFVYSASVVVDQKVSLKTSSIETVNGFLEDVIKNMDLNYQMLENNLIVITSKNDKPFIQELTIKGKVTDLEGNSLPGVNIVEKGTTNGAVTNLDGNYSISVSTPEATLIFSYVGFLTEEIKVNAQTIINIILVEDIQALEEVVVIGYGTMKKSDLTGSVASVSSDALEAFPSPDVQTALQGRAAGVHVITQNNAPGENVKIRIRGNTSINAGNDPLFVVDGFAGASLPPAEDIESVEILKDASSTAIYGSRGANGVILITTKQGKSGETRFELNNSYSLLKVTDKYDVLNATQYAQYQNALRDAINSPLPRYDNPESLGVGTDWQDIIFRTGALQNYQVSASGGRESIRFYSSAKYYGHKGTIINSNYEKYSGRTNFEMDVTKKLKFGARMDYGYSNTDGIESQRGSGAGVLTSAFLFDPTLGIYDEEGNFTRTSIDFPLDNPYALATERVMERTQNSFMGNLFVDINLLESLNFHSSWGADIYNYKRGTYSPRTIISGEAAKGAAGISSSQSNNLITENYLTYNKIIDDANKFNIMAGYSYQKYSNFNYGTGSSEFVTDAFLYYNLAGGAAYSTPSSNFYDWKMASFYSRLNYNFKDRYLLTFTGRYDGSSRFGANNKWAFFPSGAFAWNVGQEPFMELIDKLSHLKIRVSYGETGNTEIGSYSSLARLGTLYSSVGGTIVNNVVPFSVANGDLSWENTAQTDVGIDIGFFNHRFNLTVDYYKMITSDLLYSVPLPLYTGYSSSLQNLGKIQNMGWEFTLNTVNIEQAFTWNTDFNISFNKNKVLELYGGDIIISNSPGHIRGGATHLLREGESLGTMFGYVFDGLYQNNDPDLANEPGKEPGDEKIRDVNGRDGDGELTGVPDGSVNDDDRTIMGDANPDFIFGLTNSFSYKNFDLNFFLQGSVGNDILNFTRMELETMNGADNVSTAFLNAWTPYNTDTNVPKVSDITERVSTRWIEDGSYVRLKNISLGYNMPSNITSNWAVEKIRIYLSAQNLLTLTNYSGLDPEVSWNYGTTSFGGDYDSYPAVKTLTVGVNLEF